MSDSIKIVDNRDSVDSIKNFRNRASVRASVATRVIRSQRTSLYRVTWVLLAAVCVWACTVIAVITTRPTHLEGAALTTPNGELVETGDSFAVGSLFDLPLMAHQHGNEAFTEAFDRLETVRIPSVVFGGTRSERVSAWEWMSRTRMTIQTQEGSTILITNGTVFTLSASAPVGRVHFSGVAALPVGAGSAINASDIFVDATSRCAALACPLADCKASVGTLFVGEPVEDTDGVTTVEVYSMSAVSEVRCDGVPLWRWPEGVEAPPTPSSLKGRRLGIIKAIGKVLRNAYCTVFKGKSSTLPKTWTYDIDFHKPLT